MDRHTIARQVFYEFLDTRSFLGTLFFWTIIQNVYDRWLDKDGE